MGQALAGWTAVPIGAWVARLVGVGEWEMAIGREQRRIERRARVSRQFPETEVGPALDLLELLELAWHDCYGDVTPPEDVVDDVLLLSGGELAGLIRSVRLAVVDWRDLKISAAAIR